MTKIVAKGTPIGYAKVFGPVTITVTGDRVNINSIKFEYPGKTGELAAGYARKAFDRDMERGPHYPLCADPNTMRCALFILLEWFGEDKSAWVEEPKHVKVVEGEVEPMPSEPGVMY